MKAFLLAAGLGTRLYPVTASIPKCLVPIQGRPLLEIWLELLENAGVDRVLINTHHLGSQIRDFAKHWTGSPRITLTTEENLLGSAGCIAHNWEFVEEEESFLVCYSDNLTDVDLGRFLAFHNGHSGLVSAVVFRPENPAACGVVELGEGGAVLSFEEKPAVPRSPFASGGIYAMRNDIRRLLPHTTPADIGHDLLPNCLGAMYGWIWDGLLIDIGTPGGYSRAQLAWSRKTGEAPSLAPVGQPGWTPA